MKTREQQRAEILKECARLSKLHADTAKLRKERWGKEIDEFIGISSLQEAILKAMEVKPAIDELHTEMARLGRRGPSRKVSWRYTKYSNEQKNLADKVIRRMAEQGYIELKCDDTVKNIWKFKVLKTK